MKRINVCLGVCLVCFLCGASLPAQQPAREGDRPQRSRPPVAAEPALPGESGDSTALGVTPEVSVFSVMKFKGVLKDWQGQLRTSITGVTFALYAEQEGGAPLWLETQNVKPDEKGRYAVLLGATQNEGLPLELFSSEEARWLGIQVQGEAEQPRILLVSVPYALKAKEAEKLSGKSASDFVLTEELEKTVVEQVETTAKEMVVQETEEQITTKTIQSGASTFTDSNSTEVVKVAQNGSGVGLRAAAAQSSAIIGVTNATSGGKAGLRGVTSEPSGVGIFGIANSTTGVNSGVRGEASGDTGRGIVGRALSPTGNTIGIRGVVFSDQGTGISALVDSTSGATVGLEAEVRSPSGTAAILRNTSDGKLLSGVGSTGEVFSVDSSTSEIVRVTQNAPGIFDADLDNLPPIAVLGEATATNDTAVGVAGLAASPDGAGVVGVNTQTAGEPVGVYGEAAGPTGRTVGVRGEVASPDGTGVQGDAEALTGVTTGVWGTVNSSTDSAAGVFGEATAPTGATDGVIGISYSEMGNGVLGVAAFAPGGQGWGVLGISDSDMGAGVVGVADADCCSTVGVAGVTTSFGGTAGLFVNFPGGKILSARTGIGEFFSVEGNGEVIVHGQGSGIVLKSPDGLTCARFSIDNSGALVTSTVTCPPTGSATTTGYSQGQSDSMSGRALQERLERSQVLRDKRRDPRTKK